MAKYRIVKTGETQISKYGRSGYVSDRYLLQEKWWFWWFFKYQTYQLNFVAAKAEFINMLIKEEKEGKREVLGFFKR